jgi:DNA-binding FadR family transcriptional regulator
MVKSGAIALIHLINRIYSKIMSMIMMYRYQPASEFLDYLVASSQNNQGAADPAQLPSLQDLSKEMGVSVAYLREQVEVAKALGLVEVRPRTGIRRLPYTFSPAVRQSLAYAIQIDNRHFDEFADLRNQIEAAYWDRAVRLLLPADLTYLQDLVTQAWGRLRGQPVHIPHTEHRLLHLGIYQRLQNPFVNGILEAYWDAYEAVGLNLFADYAYLTQVWTYHQQMVDAIRNQDFQAGYQALIEHKDLLHHRLQPALGESTALPDQSTASP